MKSKETKLKRTSGSKDKVKPKKERKSTVKDPKKTKSPIIYAHEQWSMGYKFPSNIYQAYLIAGMTHEGEQNQGEAALIEAAAPSVAKRDETSKGH